MYLYIINNILFFTSNLLLFVYKNGVFISNRLYKYWKKCLCIRDWEGLPENLHEHFLLSLGFVIKCILNKPIISISPRPLYWKSIPYFLYYQKKRGREGWKNIHADLSLKSHFYIIWLIVTAKTFKEIKYLTLIFYSSRLYFASNFAIQWKTNFIQELKA